MFRQEPELGRSCPLNPEYPEAQLPDLSEARKSISQQFAADKDSYPRIISQLLESGQLNLLEIASQNRFGEAVSLSSFGVTNAGDATLEFLKDDSGKVSYAKLNNLKRGSNRFEEDVRFNHRGEMVFDKVSLHTNNLSQFGSMIVDGPHMNQFSIMDSTGDRRYTVDHNNVRELITLHSVNQPFYSLFERGRGVELLVYQKGASAIDAYFDFDDKGLCAKLLPDPPR